MARSAASASGVLICALALGLSSARMMAADVATGRDAAAEQKAVDALRGVATNIQFHLDKTVRLVRFSHPQSRDDVLAHLPAFSRIEYLAVVGPQFTDEGLRFVIPLKSLDTLLIEDAQLTDAVAAEFENLPKLERLYLTRTQVTDRALENIGKLASLTTLDLAGTRVTDAGLQHLTRLPELDFLDLSDTQVTDEGLAHLAAIPKLRVLILSGTQISSAGLSHLEKRPSLEHLVLDRTAIDDRAVEPLSRLRPLKVVTFYHCSVSPDAQRSIRSALGDTFVAGPPLPAAQAATAPSENESSPGATRSAERSAEVIPPARDRFASAEAAETPSFQQHVLPLLGRLGCNGRACHGSFQGQGGFRLSMFGYDFAADHKALTAGDHPRVNLQSPEESLILTKPTSDENHGGGKRFDKGGWEHQLLKRWIAAGAPGLPSEAPTFLGLEVTPGQLVFSKPGERISLKAIANWSNGVREDVTCLCRFQSNDESVADVDLNGQVTAKGSGDTYIITFYDNGVSSTEVILPVSDRTGGNYPDVPAPTTIDRLVVEKLSRLGIVPSELCSDEDFLRRISLDLVGTLPTPDEIQAFVDDPSPGKRSRKIDELLERPAYVTWWTTRLCDLTGSNAGYLGGTEMAQPVAEQWRHWIERRVRDNVGYDKIVRGLVTARSRRDGQSYAEFAAEQSTYTRRSEPADASALENSMPYFWARSTVSQPKDKALSFGYTFLGVRLECAECHKHPYDQWSQQDFLQFMEFFNNVTYGQAPDAAERHKQLQIRLGVPEKLNTAATRRQSYLRIASEGRPIPWSELYIRPFDARQRESPPQARLLGAETLTLADGVDPREALMDWMLRDDNPYFARAFVNRIWANYFNVGIVEPPDDHNLANPPSNKPLLDYLATEFVRQGYDIKWLHREIANSRTYQLSWEPNETNARDERNFSRAVIRRLPAEVIVDGVHQATAADRLLATAHQQVANRKIGQHPRSYQTRAIDYSLLIFGKPLRTINCDCERQFQPTLLQALYLRNDGELFDTLDRSDGWLRQLSAEYKLPLAEGTDAAAEGAGAQAAEALDTSTLDRLVREAYLRTLSRQPTADELTESLKHLEAAGNPLTGLRDLLWALLNTQEFITNH